MRLTTRGRYAVTAMLHMALNNHSSNKAPFSLAEISSKLHISLSYLEQIFHKLRRANLVQSFRGASGGYRLSKNISQITIAQIIDAVDESIDATHCGGKGDCNHGEMCLTHHLWEDLTDRIREFLEAITLAQLIESRHNPVATLGDIEQMLQFKN